MFCDRIHRNSFIWTRSAWPSEKNLELIQEGIQTRVRTPMRLRRPLCVPGDRYGCHRRPLCVAGDHYVRLRRPLCVSGDHYDRLRRPPWVSGDHQGRLMRHGPLRLSDSSAQHRKEVLTAVPYSALVSSGCPWIGSLLNNPWSRHFFVRSVRKSLFWCKTTRRTRWDHCLEDIFVRNDKYCTRKFL